MTHARAMQCFGLALILAQLRGAWLNQPCRNEIISIAVDHSSAVQICFSQRERLVRLVWIDWGQGGLAI